jgi:hypothetical protein
MYSAGDVVWWMKVWELGDMVLRQSDELRTCFLLAVEASSGDSVTRET